jgi:hypothetical protein
VAPARVTCYTAVASISAHELSSWAYPIPCVLARCRGPQRRRSTAAHSTACLASRSEGRLTRCLAETRRRTCRQPTARPPSFSLMSVRWYLSLSLARSSLVRATSGRRTSRSHCAAVPLCCLVTTSSCRRRTEGSCTPTQRRLRRRRRRRAPRRRPAGSSSGRRPSGPPTTRTKLTKLTRSLQRWCSSTSTSAAR